MVDNMDKNFKICLIQTKNAVDRAISWARDEGWCPGDGDACPFFVADPQGFHQGLLGGEPVSQISVVRHSPNFAFIGLYIVKPEYRGKGYGIKTFEHGMKSVSDSNIGLDAVLEHESTYAQSGFITSHYTTRFCWTYVLPSEGKDAENPDVQDISAMKEQEIVRYDEEIFPANRAAFLASWIHQPRVISLACVRSGRLAGYGVIRPAGPFLRIGPLFADNEAAAADILDALAARALRAVQNHDGGGSGEGVDLRILIDVPETNQAAMALAAGRGMAAVFRVARMYTRGPPPAGVARVFGFTCLELG